MRDYFLHPSVFSCIGHEHRFLAVVLPSDASFWSQFGSILRYLWRLHCFFAFLTWREKVAKALDFQIFHILVVYSFERFLWLMLVHLGFRIRLPISRYSAIFPRFNISVILGSLCKVFLILNVHVSDLPIFCHRSGIL